VQHNHYLFTHLRYVLLLHYLAKRWIQLERSDRSKLHVYAQKLMPYLCQDAQALSLSILALRLMAVIIANYRDVVLMQQMLPFIRSTAGDAYVFQQDSAPAYCARQTLELLQYEHIHCSRLKASKVQLVLF